MARLLPNGTTIARHTSWVKKKDMPGFCDLGNGIDRFSLMYDSNEIGGCWQISIPEIVMNCLKVPQSFPGTSVQCENAVSEQIGAFSITSEKVWRF